MDPAAGDTAGAGDAAAGDGDVEDGAVVAAGKGLVTFVTLAVVALPTPGVANRGVVTLAFCSRRLSALLVCSGP